MKQHLILILILVLASLLRFYGLNWDQNQHLHPDERFLTMVDQAIHWPKSLGEYFSTATSPLNPHNVGFPFFIYGTLPLFLTKYLSEIFGFINYDQFTLFGRAVSAIFDLLTVIFIFLIGQKIFSQKIGLLAAFFYSISVLPIQLSHFFTVDTFLNFFLVATLYFLIQFFHTSSSYRIALAGLFFGLALASKISAVLLTPAIFLVFVFAGIRSKSKIILPIGLLILTALFAFRIAQPYAFASSNPFDFHLNSKFITNLKELGNMSQPDANFPPGVQWYYTTPILYPLINLVFWGWGLPLGLISLISLIAVPARLGQKLILILATVIGTVFFYQGIQFAKPLRYFLPLFPPLSLITAYTFDNFFLILQKKINYRFALLTFAFCLLTFTVWPLAFISIYSRPHTRVQASEWIYQNIPAGSTLSFEYWDDSLPLNLSNHSPIIYERALSELKSSAYKVIPFPLYDPDTIDKWIKMKNRLNQVDYIILSSNRLYGSITRVPEKYPLTNQFYQALFDGSLGFRKVAEFTSRPTLPFPLLNICLAYPWQDYGKIARSNQECNSPGISFVDDYTDETYTVYDHPKVIIFVKKSFLTLRQNIKDGRTLFQRNFPAKKTVI